MSKIITAIAISIILSAISLPATAAESNVIKNRYFVGIGISKFKDAKMPVNKTAANNANNFADYLEARGGYEKKNIKVLTNENATRQKILATLFNSWLPRVIAPNDLAVIYISTTITSPGKDTDGNRYFAAYDTDENSLYSSGIHLESFPNMIASRLRGKFVLIIEGDNSGAAEFDSGVKSDAIILTSCGANQKSFNEKNDEGSVFTNRLIDVIADGEIEDPISKVMNEVQVKVKTQIKKERGVSQEPQIKSKWTGKMPCLQPPVDLEN